MYTPFFEKKPKNPRVFTLSAGVISHCLERRFPLYLQGFSLFSTVQF